MLHYNQLLCTGSITGCIAIQSLRGSSVQCTLGRIPKTILSIKAFSLFTGCPFSYEEMLKLKDIE